MTAYYNENDSYAAQWLRNLIEAGHIADGCVDERDIRSVHARDLEGYAQCHFFAGIGGWSLALRLAGWPDDRPVWTGSCPCQPFSAAGAGKAADDERHLWPAWFPLIAQRRPAIVFGEQVEAAVGWGWLDAVFADLEAEGYACGATVLPACGVGAPHIRSRVWFVADLQEQRWHTGRPSEAGRRAPLQSARYRDDHKLADANGARRQVEQPQSDTGSRHSVPATRNGRSMGHVADAISRRCQGPDVSVRPARQDEAAAIERRSPDWLSCAWLPCTDGKARPVEPGTFPLAHGIPGRVGRLRAYGNAIVPQVAAEFIRASVGT